MTDPELHIGTAGWSIPALTRNAFPPQGSALSRYSTCLSATEINSCFYRSHRPATYARWAASVPEAFRFSVKLPKIITHEQRLERCEDQLAAFAVEIAGLEEHLGPILIQLPPSLIFEQNKIVGFLAAFRKVFAGPAACEPRHQSWFSPDVDALLAEWELARVAADPARAELAARPGGYRGLAYFRLHGSPRIYRSSYELGRLLDLAKRARAALDDGAQCWVIFDNTASGAALANALELRGLVQQAPIGD